MSVAKQEDSPTGESARLDIARETQDGQVSIILQSQIFG